MANDTKYPKRKNHSMKRWLFVMLFLMMACEIYAAERVPGTRVSIEPPTGFEQAKQFPGYVLRDTGSSIMITEIPAPFLEISKGFNSRTPQGMALISKDVVNIDGYEALLLNVDQNAYGMRFEKWIVVFGNEKETVMITAAFPKGKNELSDTLKQAVLSAQWNPNAKVDFFEGLTFKVAEYGGFKIANKVGNNLTLTFGGAFPVKNEDDPVIVVGALLIDSKMITDRKQFARKSVYQTATLSNFKILEESDVRVAALPGRRIIAKAKDTKTGHDRLLYSVYLYNSDECYVFNGIADFSKREEYQSIFSSILNSFSVN